MPWLKTTGKCLAHSLFFISTSFGLFFAAQVKAQETLIIDVTVFGLNENQTKTITQLDLACDTIANPNAQESQLLALCNEINALDPNNADDSDRLKEIADSVGVEELFAIVDSLVSLSDFQTTNVRARLDSLRQRFAAANNDDSTQSFNSSQALAPSGGGASDDFVSALGVFINGHSSSGSTEGGIFQQNTDTSSSSLSLGADYRFNNNIVAGLGVGFLQDQNDFAAAGGSIDSESFNTTAYATWFNADLYFDIVLDIALAEYDVQRSIALAPGTEVSASSTVDSSLSSLTISGGKNFRLANWDLGGYFRLSLSRGQIDGFSESINEEQTGFGTAFSVDDQTVESTEGVLGFEVSRAFSLQKAVLVPLLRLEYVSNIERDKEDIQSNLLLTDTDFEFFGDQREASYYNLGIGTSAVFAKGRSLYAFYETHLQHDTINNNWIKAGVRFEF